MSNTDGPMRVVSFKLPVTMDQELTQLARRQRTSRSALVRSALGNLGRNRQRSALDLAADLVGSLRGAAPRDLATNPRHLESYGR